MPTDMQYSFCCISRPVLLNIHQLCQFQRFLKIEQLYYFQTNLFFPHEYHLHILVIGDSNDYYNVSKYCSIIWVKVFKSGPGKFLPQILLGPLLNTLSPMTMVLLLIWSICHELSNARHVRLHLIHKNKFFATIYIIFSKFFWRNNEKISFNAFTLQKC